MSKMRCVSRRIERCHPGIVRDPRCAEVTAREQNCIHTRRSVGENLLLDFAGHKQQNFAFPLDGFDAAIENCRLSKIQNPSPRGCLVFPKTRFQNPSDTLLARGATKILSVDRLKMSDLERGES